MTGRVRAALALGLLARIVAVLDELQVSPGGLEQVLRRLAEVFEKDALGRRPVARTGA